MVGAAAIDAAGDTVYLSQSHSESTASAVTISLAGTLASPVRLICGNDAAEPPTSVATTAVVATTGGSSLQINGGCYAYGITFKASNNTGGANLILLPGVDYRQFYENCSFELNGTNSANNIQIGSTTGAEKIHWKNCTFRLNNASQYIGVLSCEFVVSGGSVISGSTAITGGLVRTGATARGSNILFEGVDFSNLGSASYLAAPPNAPGRIVFRNCKLPASWTGGLVSTAVTQAGTLIEMYNCDSADTNYRLWTESYSGSVRHDSGVYLDASDGTTSISWKMVSSANAAYPYNVLRSPEIVKWNETTGSAITATVEVVLDSATALNNDDCWLEVQYLGTSGYPLGSFITDCKADVLATAAAQDSSSATWTGTGGFSNEQKRKLSVTFTPQEKGYIHAVVCLAKASATVYVDPLLTVS
jgi:hypothetical protein